MSRWRSPWTLPARVLENEAMTIRAPASIAASYGARWMPEGRLVDVGDALVDRVARRRGRAPGRPAVAEEVLGGGGAAVGRGQVVALEPADERLAELRDARAGPRRSPRRCGPSARPAAPPRPARSPSGCPWRPSRARSPGRSAHQAGSAAAPRPTLCGKIVAPGDVVVAVDGVDAVEDRDAEAGRRARRPGRRRPSRTSRRRRSARRAAAAAQDGAEQQVVTPAGSTEPCSSWVICPIFSSIVISARRACGAGGGREGRVVPVDGGRGRRCSAPGSRRGRRRRGRGRPATRDEHGREEQGERRPGTVIGLLLKRSMGTPSYRQHHIERDRAVGGPWRCGPSTDRSPSSSRPPRP